MDKPVRRARVSLQPGKGPPAPVSARTLPPPLVPVEQEDPLDRVVHASIAELAGGFSPMALALAASDWALHLMASPGRQASLALSALARQASLLQPTHPSAGAKPDQRQGGAEDRRFRATNGANGRSRSTPTRFWRPRPGGTKQPPRFTAPRPTIWRS